MRIDCSEVKSFRECGRKHMFNSRNRMHLQPVAPNGNLVFGTQFHEVLAMMYLGTPLDKLLEWINREVTDVTAWKIMNAMCEGYYNGPYQIDKDRYVLVDIEKSFNYPIELVNPEEVATGEEIRWIPSTDPKLGAWIGVDAYGGVHEAICACGSIDMICIDTKTGKMVGFEHKTAKNFRPEVYDLIDEQPRLYTWALQRILVDYHRQGKYLEVTDTGPIFLNQVRKLQNKFEYHRSVCEYTESDMRNFMTSFVATLRRIAHEKLSDELPVPGFMKCQMCDYADLCMHYGYATIDKKELLDEFEGEFVERDHDHLDEKASRHNEEAE